MPWARRPVAKMIRQLPDLWPSNLPHPPSMRLSAHNAPHQHRHPCPLCTAHGSHEYSQLFLKPPSLLYSIGTLGE